MVNQMNNDEVRPDEREGEQEEDDEEVAQDTHETHGTPMRDRYEQGEIAKQQALVSWKRAGTCPKFHPLTPVFTSGNNVSKRPFLEEPYHLHLPKGLVFLPHHIPELLNLLSA